VRLGHVVPFLCLFEIWLCLCCLQFCSASSPWVSWLCAVYALWFSGIITVAAKLSNVTHVLRHFATSGSDDGVVVDVICNYGQTWIKIIARNSKALNYDIAGEYDAIVYKKSRRCNPVQRQYCFGIYNWMAELMVLVQRCLDIPTHNSLNLFEVKSTRSWLMWAFPIDIFA